MPRFQNVHFIPAERYQHAYFAHRHAPQTWRVQSRRPRAFGIDGAGARPPIGVGTPRRIPLFSGSSSIGNSQLFQSGPFIGLGVTTPLDSFGACSVHEYHRRRNPGFSRSRTMGNTDDQLQRHAVLRP